MTKLTADQYGFLTGEINGGRVRHLRGNAHLEAWDVRRHLIRAFGFGGFDIVTKSLELVTQIEHAPGTIKRGDKGATNDRTLWTVVYRAEIRLIIKAPDGTVLASYDDGAAGDAANQPSLGDAHDQASKTALSQGLKRCAVNLGDQFGLSLYNGGDTRPVVVRSLVYPDVAGEPAAALPADDAPVLPEPGANGHGDDPHASAPVSGPPANGSVSMRARALFETITSATTEAALRDAYAEIGPALDAGEITQAEAKQLADHVRSLKAQLPGVQTGADAA